MKKIVINGKEYTAEKDTSLKKLLKDLGFVFPCGGQGRCGRCKISCKDIEPTQLDNKFFNAAQLDDGARLACDKLIKSDYKIDIEPSLLGIKETITKLSECRISVSLGIQNIAISILDDEIVETVVRPNPLREEGKYSTLCQKYSNDRAVFSKLLRNCIGKESVELFEKYGTAKADTLAIGASEFYIKILLGIPLNQEIDDYNEFVENDNLSLPTEQIYILPMLNQYFGGDLLCETVELKEHSLLIDCQDICALAYIDKEENTVAAMWDMSYADDLELVSIKAAVRALITDKPQPLVYLYGDYIDALAPIVEELDLTHIDNHTKRIENIAKACLYSRFRAKLNKEKTRTTYIDIVNNNDFHQFFAQDYKG